MIHSGGENQEQIIQHHGFVIQVKLDGLIVQLNIGGFGNDVFKMGLPPGLGGMGHHG